MSIYLNPIKILDFIFSIIVIWQKKSYIVISICVILLLHMLNILHVYVDNCYPFGDPSLLSMTKSP